MARTTTPADLLTRAQDRSDMQNSEFVSTAEWYRSMNNWLSILWNKMLQADPDRFTKEQTLPSGTQDHDCPADYYGTVAVDYVSDATQGVYCELPRVRSSEENRIAQTRSGHPVAYTFRYNDTTPSTPTLRVLPTPDTDLRHRYTVAPPRYATDGTDSAELIAGIAGFEEYIVIGMAIDALIKEKSSVVQLRESQAYFEAMLDMAIEARSIDEAGHVTDSRTEGQYIDPASVREYGVY